MARRPGLLTPRRQADVGGVGSFGSGSHSQKSSSPVVVVLLIVSAILFVGYTYSNSAFHHSQKKEVPADKSDVVQVQEAVELTDPDDNVGDADSTVETKLSKGSKTFVDSEPLFAKRPKTYPLDIVKAGDADDSRETAGVTADDDGEDGEKKEDIEDVEEARSHEKPNHGSRSVESECHPSLCQAIPLLQDLYGEAMHKILHIGRGSCGIVHELLKEDNIEVWGLEPEEIKPPLDSTCENFIKKGRVRVAEPGSRLPYRPGSFSLILISDALDKLTPGILRKALKEYERVTLQNLIVVVDAKPKRLRSKQGKLLKPRLKAYWVQKFEESGLKIDEEKTQRFENLQQEKSFKTNRIFFHLIPERLVSAER